MYDKYLNFVEGKFRECFSNKGYLQEKPVGITSQIDQSVTFIGSATSPMKPCILSGAIGKQGRFLLQNSLRTRGLNNLKQPVYSMFGSYFISMGAYVEYRDLGRLVSDTFDYLIEHVRIPLKDIVIRINRKDADLMDSVKQIDNRIIREYNTFEEKYYQHKYGLERENIRGRNFNIGIRKRNTDLFLDIGNVIVMGNENESIAVELALGNCTMSMSYFGVDSTVASSRMGDVFKIDTVEKMKLADSIIVCAILIYEDVKRIKTPRWPNYLFRRYCSALEFWKNRLKVPDEVIVGYMRKFLSLEYQNDIALSDEEIINYIKVPNKKAILL